MSEVTADSVTAYGWVGIVEASNPATDTTPICASPIIVDGVVAYLWAGIPVINPPPTISAQLLMIVLSLMIGLEL